MHAGNKAPAPRSNPTKVHRDDRSTWEQGSIFIASRMRAFFGVQASHHCLAPESHPTQPRG